MSFPAKVLLAASVSALAAAAPAAAADTAPPTVPVAHIFKFTSPSVTTTGAPPQPLIRVDHKAADSVTARLVLTPTTKAGKVKRSAKRISVNLGSFGTNQVVGPAWPANLKLKTGYYSVKLNATAADGSKLARPAGAAGQAKLKVAKGVVISPTPASGPIGARMVALAQAEIGVVEIPKGSNDAPRIATYRTATPGGLVGAWCAYFTSWLASTAGSPVGDRGQGYGRVDDLYAWAQRTGKALPAAGVPIAPGDFMVWDEHIGVVESVGADGTITTIDGNYLDAVTRRVLPADRRGGVLGYVRL
ncbi:MAG TPA: CHAP domain-containing protein [Baekduia sp.]|nr:CHAP domain-containing protein [Baekduia sp.]